MIEILGSIFTTLKLIQKLKKILKNFLLYLTCNFQLYVSLLALLDHTLDHPKGDIWFLRIESLGNIFFKATNYSRPNISE